MKPLLLLFAACLLVVSAGCATARPTLNPVREIKVEAVFAPCKQRSTIPVPDWVQNEHLCGDNNAYLIESRENAFRAIIDDRDAIIDCYESRAGGYNASASH